MLVFIAGFLAGFILIVFFSTKRGLYVSVPDRVWSVGIYEGLSPFSVAAPSGLRNPVLTREDINDTEAFFVADPFMIQHEAVWYMFFEVYQVINGLGCIGLATSKDGHSWSYKKIVLREPFHLSFPYLLKWQNSFYMIPECSSTQTVRLYKADRFPDQWVFEKTLISGRDFVDPCLFYKDGIWWLFASNVASNELRLYFSKDLTGEWKEHPSSPVTSNNQNTSRPAGKILEYQNRLYRYAQSDTPSYGNQVLLVEITKLTETEYAEKISGRNPVLRPGHNGWTVKGMHHIDPHPTRDGRWIACVDGQKNISFLERRLIGCFRLFNYRFFLSVKSKYAAIVGKVEPRVISLKKMLKKAIFGKEHLRRLPDRIILEDKIFSYLKEKNDIKKILFVGCEPVTAHYHKYFDNKEYWTIDSDPLKAKYGSVRHLTESVENLSLHFHPDYFDAIIMNGVIGWGLDLYENAEKAISDCFFCLRPGGLLILGWNDFQGARPFYPEELESLKRFQPYSFAPFYIPRYKVVNSRNGHTFDFYTKPTQK